MKYSTVYAGIVVHKESFSLCYYTNEKEKAEYSELADCTGKLTFTEVERGFGTVKVN